MRSRVWPSRVWLIALFALTISLPTATDAAEYKIDAAHTSVGFKVRHLFTNVDGRFDKFDGTIVFDAADPTKSKVMGEIDAATVNTNLANRDKHLRSGDFFDVENHPKITFESTKFTLDGSSKTKGKMQGKLTIRGNTKDVVLDVAYLGAGVDPYGNKKAGFSGEVTINRKDFGLTWNDTLETGGLLVGEEVKIEINVEANAQEG